MPRHAYTLVEVLAVTVLLGLLATLGAPPMLRAMAGDPLERAAARLIQGFRDTRAQAYGHRLELELDASGFIPVRGDGQDAAPVRLGEAVQVSWSRRNQQVARLSIDPRGHSLDLDVTMRLDERELSYAVDGLTGRWLAKARP